MKIKVLHVQLTENLGGIESLLINVYRKIDKQKFQFDFISNGYSDYQKELSDMGAKIYQMPSIKHIKRYISTFNKILDNNYDVIHFHKNSAANIIPLLIAKGHISHPKIIVHSHNSSPSINKKSVLFFHHMNKPIINIVADKKIACSKRASMWMFNNYKKNVDIINNGINTSKFRFSSLAREKIRQKYHIDDQTLVIGNVGRFSKQKNHTFIIKIFKNILEERPNAILFLIGTGKLENEVKKFTNKLNISQHVYFLGNKKNVADYLSAMDIFIMPSLFEGLPIAAVEAQASGVNVFVSKAITKELFLTNIIHSFSLKEDPKEIAREILYFKKPIDRQKEVEAIRKAGYDLSNTVTRFQSVYYQLIK